MKDMLITLDLKAGTPLDYSKLVQVLGAMGFTSTTPDGNVRLPNTTFVGRTTFDGKGLRDQVRMRLAQSALDVARIVVSSFDDWAAWGPSVQAA